MLAQALAAAIVSARQVLIDHFEELPRALNQFGNRLLGDGWRDRIEDALAERDAERSEAES